MGEPTNRLAWEHIHKSVVSHSEPAPEVIAFAIHLQQRLPPKPLLLDAGCGKGRNAIYLAQIGFQVIGCDISMPAIQAIPASNKIGLNFQNAYLCQLPYVDEGFTAVLCCHVLPYHRPSQIRRILQEFWRVLKPRGWLYADFLDCADVEYGQGKELESDTFISEDGIPMHFGTRQSIVAMLSPFSIVQMNQLKLGSPSRQRLAWEVWAQKKEPSHV